MNDEKYTRRIPAIIFGLGLILIAASGYFILKDVPFQNDPATVPAKVNYPAPELILTDINDNTHSLADYQGHVALVNLWATWCPPCEKEMPALQAYYKKHNDEGFVVIAINDGETAPKVIQFVKEYNLTFPVWLDPTYIATEQAFKTLNLPSSFVIDRSGFVRLQWVGEINRRMLEKFVTPIIKENQQ
ncbi:MAG TPA: alkyl hydroperoxide reductase [Anaerolineae bacterium]|nr:alkyl hydroperoxide reductase [Anaerolineae bacterium]